MRTIALVDKLQLSINLNYVIARFLGSSLNSGVSRKNRFPRFGVVPMVKANAYGHGLLHVANQLAAHDFVRGLGVATIDEASAVRQILSHRKLSKPVWVFSESALFTEDTWSLCARERFEPIIYDLETLRYLVSRLTRFSTNARHGLASLRFHIKFNSGMNRLGIAPSDVSVVRTLLKRIDAEYLSGVCSHFADSEHSQSQRTLQQVDVFRTIVGSLGTQLLAGDKSIHFANTDASLTMGNHLSAWTNTIRPGLALYGYCSSRVHQQHLKPVLQWWCRSVQDRKLTSGALVGYGAGYQIPKGSKLGDQSIFAVGYGDGFARTHSGKKILVSRVELSSGELTQELGNTNHSKALEEVLVGGYVSMDLTSICMPFRKRKVSIREPKVPFYGLIGQDPKQAWRLAKNMNSNLYEVLTRISSRVPRVLLTRSSRD